MSRFEIHRASAAEPSLEALNTFTDKRLKLFSEPQVQMIPEGMSLASGLSSD